MHATSSLSRTGTNVVRYASFGRPASWRKWGIAEPGDGDRESSCAGQNKAVTQIPARKVLSRFCPDHHLGVLLRTRHYRELQDKSLKRIDDQEEVSVSLPEGLAQPSHSVKPEAAFRDMSKLACLVITSAPKRHNHFISLQHLGSMKP
jgi:hypothetical protein